MYTEYFFKRKFFFRKKKKKIEFLDGPRNNAFNMIRTLKIIYSFNSTNLCPSTNWKYQQNNIIITRRIWMNLKHYNIPSYQNYTEKYFQWSRVAIS